MHHSDLILSYVCELCAPWMPKNEVVLWCHLRVGLLPHEVAKLFELLGILKHRTCSKGVFPPGSSFELWVSKWRLNFHDVNVHMLKPPWGSHQNGSHRLTINRTGHLHVGKAPGDIRPVLWCGPPGVHHGTKSMNQSLGMISSKGFCLRVWHYKDLQSICHLLEWFHSPLFSRFPFPFKVDLIPKLRVQ